MTSENSAPQVLIPHLRLAYHISLIRLPHFRTTRMFHINDARGEGSIILNSKHIACRPRLVSKKPVRNRGQSTNLCNHNRCT